VADDSAGNGGDGTGSVKSAPELFLNRADNPLLYAFNELASFRDYEKTCATAEKAVKQLDEHLGGNVTQHPLRRPRTGRWKSSTLHATTASISRLGNRTTKRSRPSLRNEERVTIYSACNKRVIVS